MDELSKADWSNLKLPHYWRDLDPFSFYSNCVLLLTPGIISLLNLDQFAAKETAAYIVLASLALAGIYVKLNFFKLRSGLIVGSDTLTRIESRTERWSVPIAALTLHMGPKNNLTFYDESSQFILNKNLIANSGQRTPHYEKQLIAYLIDRCRHFELVKEPLEVRKKRYLITGLTFLVVTCTLGLYSVNGIREMYANAALGIWLKTQSLILILTTIISCTTGLLTLTELSWFFRDGKNADLAEEKVRAFVEVNKKLTRTQMKPGIWYKYRGLERTTNEFKWLAIGAGVCIFFVMLFMEFLYTLPTYRSQKNPDSSFTFELSMILIAGMALFSLPILYYKNLATHRFCVADGFLHVQTRKGLKVFPLASVRPYKGHSTSSSIRSEPDRYGRWPKSYSLDPRYIVECDNEQLP